MGHEMARGEDVKRDDGVESENSQDSVFCYDMSYCKRRAAKSGCKHLRSRFERECDSKSLASAVPAEPHQKIEQRENGLKRSGHIRPSRRVQHLSDILLVLIRNHAERRKLRFGTPACIELDRKIDDLKEHHSAKEHDSRFDQQRQSRQRPDYQQSRADAAAEAR